MKRNELLVNGKTAIWNQEVKLGDEIIYSPTEKKRKTFHLNIDVIYEDEFIAVINKPAGYPVSGNSFKTIQNALNNNLKPSKLLDAFLTPRPVHRLDSQTAGLLIVAKNLYSANFLGKQFEERSIKKVYKCICKNHFPDQLLIDTPINGHMAQTNFRRDANINNKFLGELALVSACPLTGRTHQIRKHLSGNGYPILGDKLYGEYFNKGLFLFAESLNFRHPNTQEELQFKLDLPNKFLNIINHQK